MQSKESNKKRSEKLKGRVPWNKGKTGVYSIETLKKKSDATKGRPKSLETHKRMSEGAKGKKMSIEAKFKMSQFQKQRKRTPLSLITKAKISNSLKGQKFSEERITNIIKASREALKNKTTSIERKLYGELQRKNIDFEKQKLVGRFIVDAYIPSLNLVIEADGVYWHNLDRIKKKDKAENAYILKCGYKLLRISETDFINDTYIDILEREI